MLLDSAGLRDGGELLTKLFGKYVRIRLNSTLLLTGTLSEGLHEGYFSMTLLNLTGIGPARERRLKEIGINTVQDLAKATVLEISGIPGVTTTVAESLKSQAVALTQSSTPETPPEPASEPDLAESTQPEQVKAKTSSANKAKNKKNKAPKAKKPKKDKMKDDKSKKDKKKDSKPKKDKKKDETSKKGKKKDDKSKKSDKPKKDKKKDKKKDDKPKKKKKK